MIILVADIGGTNSRFAECESNAAEDIALDKLFSLKTRKVESLDDLVSFFNTSATGGLIISGGIAAKNPHVVQSDVFLDEFQNCRIHAELLRRIPISLNRREDIGLLGSAYVGLGLIQSQAA